MLTISKTGSWRRRRNRDLLLTVGMQLEPGDGDRQHRHQQVFDSSVTTFSELSKTLTIEFITLSQSPISADSSISLAGVGVGFAGSWPWVVLVMMLLVLALLILVVYFRSKFASVAIILRDFNKKHDQGEMGGRAKRSGSLSAWTLQVNFYESA